MSISIRRAKPEDAPVCGQICYEAFHKISTDHNFPPDVPAPEGGVGMLTRMFSDPGFYCVVAESDGRIAGSNCLDERTAIAGVGPITIDPKVQNRGIGRKLMDAVLDRARERNFAGVRLVQAAFHNRSLSLYTTLGFDVREPLAVMQGAAIKKTYDGTKCASPGHPTSTPAIWSRLPFTAIIAAENSPMPSGKAPRLLSNATAASPDMPAPSRFTGMPSRNPISTCKPSLQPATVSRGPGS
jgi:GNAT superfamily N-acetyltransferase